MNKAKLMRKKYYPLRGYISTNRSKHNLKAHLILVCKYRKKLLQGDLNDFIKSVIDEIATQSSFIIIAHHHCDGKRYRSFALNGSIYS